jgi:hypothetical protein
MTAQLLDHRLPRQRVPGPDYRGSHRGAERVFVPGSLVHEPGSAVPSSVIRHLDRMTVLVRHVDTQDDHPVPLRDLTAFADGRRVTVGSDFGDSA